MICFIYLIFFFNDTATTEIYTLSLHDALPIFVGVGVGGDVALVDQPAEGLLAADVAQVVQHLVPEPGVQQVQEDRKSTRLNSSHANISYAVFCLKKKKTYSSILNKLCKYSTY